MEEHSVSVNRADAQDLVKYGNVEILRFLLDNGYQVTDELRHLMRRADFVDLLIEKGIDPRILLGTIANSIYHNEVYRFALNIIRKPDCPILDESILAKLFMGITQWSTYIKLSGDDLDAFVNVGLNPHCDNDRLFVGSCSYCDFIFVNHFINKYGANVNAHDGEALTHAIRRNSIQIVTLLLDAGCMVLDRHIADAFSEKEILELLIQRSGRNMEEVANRYVQTKIANNDFEVLKMFVDQGVDMNHVIQWRSRAISLRSAASGITQ